VFSSISAADVEKLVQSLSDKQCLSNPLPTWLLKKFVDVLAPFLCRLFNVCLQHGIVPSRFKSGYITPRLKKADLDATDVKSYRPISNLFVLSKLLERLVAQQLVKYLMDNRLLPDLQSAYWASHSTETAVLEVLSDILLALDSRNIVVLTLIDLSAAFDSVDHDTLIRRLRTSYGLGGTVITWFSSYLSGRTQHVRLTSTTSTPSAIVCGLPQGSVLEPILFILHVADLLYLVRRHQLSPHAFADDTQIYGLCRPGSTDDLARRVSNCVDDVTSWMRANRLQLNTSKTEVLWYSSGRRQHQIPTTASVYARPLSSPPPLFETLGADVSMKAHIAATVRSCFAALRLCAAYGGVYHIRPC